MKTRSILPFAVFGILLALLFAVSACDDDDDDPANGTPAGDFGVPYPFGGRDRMDFEEKKKEDFRCYEELRLSLSQAVELDDNLFEGSIRANKEFPDRTDGQKYDTQKYNYVIDTNGNIFVAQWNVDDIEAALNAAWDKAKSEVDAEDKCKGRQCLEDGGFTPQVSNMKVMVNLFPEDEQADPRISPCWLDRDKKDGGPGLLDAISKHLMLAQGVNDAGEGATIGDFKVNEWATKTEGDWMQAKVRYAGELTVDVVRCTYTVNNDSGTYKPKLEGLAGAAKHFANEIDVGPIMYVNIVFDEDGNRTPFPYPTDNLFDTTTKISNCP